MAKAKEAGYEITLLFFYLNSVELAKERVKIRVSKGGHNIPENVIERRYFRGLENFEKYCMLVNRWFFYDNSKMKSETIARGDSFQNIKIFNNETWKSIKK